jgi:hypothetical protein
MTDNIAQQNQVRRVQCALETLRHPGGQHFWDVFDELSALPPCYHVTVDRFREGLYSSSHYVQVVSASNVARFARDAEWALPELEGLLKRESGNVLVVSAAASAIQSLRTREAAAVLAKALDSTLQSEMPLNQKGELSTYLLRSLVSMGLIAHEQRGAFHRAIDYFAAQADRVWTPECLWELDMFCVENANNLSELVSRDPKTRLTDEVLQGALLRELAPLQQRLFGDWGVVMDSYCKFSSQGLPDRFAFLPEACFGDDLAGRNLGLARVVVLENREGVRAACVSCDETGVGPVAWHPEIAASMLHRTLNLDPWSTYILTYHLSRSDLGLNGGLVLRENPSYYAASPYDIFGATLPQIEKFLFHGGEIPDSAIAAAESLKREG